MYQKCDLGRLVYFSKFIPKPLDLLVIEGYFELKNSFCFCLFFKNLVVVIGVLFHGSHTTKCYGQGKIDQFREVDV